jgi:hypothetical protein
MRPTVRWPECLLVDPLEHPPQVGPNQSITTARGGAKSEDHTHYMEFARANPALYEAMFTLRVDLTFAQSHTPAQLHAGFVELRDALAPLAGDRNVETFTEVVWSALHGLATLAQAGRLRPTFSDQRLAMLVDQIGIARA